MHTRRIFVQIRRLITGRRISSAPKNLRADNRNHASSLTTTTTAAAAGKAATASNGAGTTITTSMLTRILAIKNYLEVGKRAKALHKKAFSDKFLLLTNVAISLGLSSTGDVLEQQYEIYTGELAAWDRQRTSHMAISGVSVGVICHYWYQLLDSRLPGRTIGVVIKKIVLDQLICSPVYISAFFITLGVLERKAPADVWQEMKDKAWKLYAAEWMIWPVAQFVNFYWLPTKYRVFYDNIISLGYDVYTSQVKHHD